MRSGSEEGSGIDGTWQINRDAESGGARRRVHARGAAEHDGQPLADVLEADAAALSRHASGSRGFSMVIDRRSPRRATSSRIMPPSTKPAMPCLTAFSSSGCRSSGGTWHSSAFSSIDCSTCRRAPNRTCSMLEKAIGQRQLLGERNALLRAEASVVRRKSASSTHIRRAAAASLPVSALIEFRLL